MCMSIVFIRVADIAKQGCKDEIQIGITLQELQLSVNQACDRFASVIIS